MAETSLPGAMAVVEAAEAGDPEAAAKFRTWPPVNPHRPPLFAVASRLGLIGISCSRKPAPRIMSVIFLWTCDRYGSSRRVP